MSESEKTNDGPLVVFAELTDLTPEEACKYKSLTITKWAISVTCPPTNGRRWHKVDE